MQERMGERVKRKDRNRRGEKDESLKGRHRIGQLLGPSLTLALTSVQLGQKGVQEGETSVAFVLITPADKPDELIGCFLLLIASAGVRQRKCCCARTGAPEGRRVLMSSAARLITGQILQRYLPMIRLPVWERTQPRSTDAVIST